MKNKATILPGLMLFASFVILMVCGMGFDFVFSRFPSLGIVLIELLAFVPPIITGEWGKWIQRALIFLVVSCPCALVISVPL